ncbi:MAG: hypothetical protein WCO59_06675 [Actinomycetes bacterium]
MKTTTRGGYVGVALVALLALMLAGCSQAQQVADQAAVVAKKAAETATKDAATAVISRVATSVARDAGVTLVSPPDCTSDLTLNVAKASAKGDVMCVGRTTDRKAFKATFKGSLTDAGCSGTLTVDIEDREPIVIDRIKDCSIAQVVGGAAESSDS